MSEFKPDGPETAPCKCDNCGWEGDISELGEIRDIQQRVFAGEEIPAGQCPDDECGACAYLVKPDDKRDVRSPAAAFAFLTEAVSAYRDSFEGDEEINGGDMVEWFSDFRTRAKAFLEEQAIRLAAEVAAAAVWTAHVGDDYAVVMRGDETTDTATIVVRSEDNMAAPKIARALNAARV